MPARRKHSDLDAEAACADLAAGMSLDELVTKYKVSRITIWRGLDKIDCEHLQRREEKVDENVAYYVKQHFSQGMTVAALSRKYALKTRTIQRIVSTKAPQDAVERRTASSEDENP